MRSLCAGLFAAAAWATLAHAQVAPEQTSDQLRDQLGPPPEVQPFLQPLPEDGSNCQEGYVWDEGFKYCAELKKTVRGGKPGGRIAGALVNPGEAIRKLQRSAKRGQRVAISAKPRVAPALPPTNLQISFENDSATLTPQAQANAIAFAELINRPDEMSSRFALDGHTNAVGDGEYNKRLSVARAQAVRDFLLTQGVIPQRIDIYGWGFGRPLPGSRPAAPENRRVEVRRLN